MPRVLFALSGYDRNMFLPHLAYAIETLNEAECVVPDTLPAKSEPGLWRALLEETRPDVIVSAWATPPVPADWIAADSPAPCPLRYLCHLGGSVRQKVPRLFLERGGLVTNWGGQAAAQVAEHALLLALATLRRAPAWLGGENGPPVRMIRIGDLDTRTLFGRRIGVHGCGSVARKLAALLRPFECDVACFSAGVPDDVVHASGMRPAGSLAELFGGKEILFECEALTPASELCVDAAMLARLPDGALFVNVARGRLLDETALLREVRSGRLQAALDVLTVEPVPADSPWRVQPGAIYSPHIAGPTGDMMPRIGAAALENLINYLAGRPLGNLVSLDLYDRAT
ncbi:2-hydroxyacid dehydrogenase [Opitutaceae bacterium TAV5]|nr:2-hydroxyacid dehydrogenase [Opitutaceae bacterium TAV5]